MIFHSVLPRTFPPGCSSLTPADGRARITRGANRPFTGEPPALGSAGYPRHRSRTAAPPAGTCGALRPPPAGGRAARPRTAPPTSGPRPALDRSCRRSGSRDGRHRRTDTPRAVRPARHTAPTPRHTNPPPLPGRALPLLPEQPGGCAAPGSRSSAGPRSAPHLALACGDSGAAAGLPWRSWARPGRGSAGAAPHTRGRTDRRARLPRRRRRTRPAQRWRRRAPRPLL